MQELRCTVMFHHFLLFSVYYKICICQVYMTGDKLEKNGSQATSGQVQESGARRRQDWQEGS